MLQFMTYACRRKKREEKVKFLIAIYMHTVVNSLLVLSQHATTLISGLFVPVWWYLAGLLRFQHLYCNILTGAAPLSKPSLHRVLPQSTKRSSPIRVLVDQ